MRRRGERVAHAREGGKCTAKKKIEELYDTKAESIPQTIPPIVYHDKMSGTVILG